MDLKKQVAELEANNHHREATVLIAETLGSDWLAYEANKLRWTRDRLGYLPHRLEAKAGEIDRQARNLLG